MIVQQCMTVVIVGGNDCGCAYCWSCNACENCLDGREEDCLRIHPEKDK